MKVKPKKFICKNCYNETYTDSDECRKCNTQGNILPIKKDTYKCYLNGVLYGAGNLSYIHELFTDYVIDCNMYGKKECDFKITKD